MNMDWDSYKKYAPFLVRIGLGLVLIWFGVDALINPGVWAALVPSWVLKILGMSANHFMFVNGIVEIILGILLLIGLYTRLVATITVLLFLGIIYSLGYGDLAVRDFGLLLAAFSLIASGAGWGSLDHRKDL